jgi:SNF2 family DNA or RNA helicase
MSQIQESKNAEAKSNILYCDDKEGDRDRESVIEGGISSTSYRNYNGDTVTHTQSSSSVGRLSYSNVLMSLRRLCNHPYLLLEDVKSIPDELYYKDLVASSGKLSLLHGLLKNLIPKGHKVSQITAIHSPLLIFHVH